jgi:hypothetical protein
MVNIGLGQSITGSFASASAKNFTFAKLSSSLRYFKTGTLTIAGVLCAVPAFATGLVNQGVDTADIQIAPQSQQNVKVSSLSPSIIPETRNFDAAFSAIGFDGTAGFGTLNVHACSSPPMFGATGLGRATGFGSFSYNDSFRVTSTTLAAGTPVDITLTADVALRDTLKFVTNREGGSGFGSAEAAQITGSASFIFNTRNPLVQNIFSGDFSRTNQYIDGEQKRKTGIFDTVEIPEALTRTSGKSNQKVITAYVGQQIDLGVMASLVTRSSAGVGTVSDVDAQMLLIWGLHSDNNDVTVISFNGDPAPDNSRISVPDTIAQLPNRPSTIPPNSTSVPEPFTIVGTLIGGVTAFRMKKKLKSIDKI